MMDFLKRLPLPAAAVSLGLFSLGNLMQSYSPTLRMVLGGLAAAIWLLVLLKVVCLPRLVWQLLNSDAAVASVAGGTFPMATMLLAAYMKPYVAVISTVLWGVAVALHLAIMVWFGLVYLAKLQWPKVFASYFVVYVGIAAASLTSAAFGVQSTWGTWLWWLAFVCLVILLAVVTWRYIIVPVQAEGAKPLVCIYAAPISLCLAGYLQVAEQKSLYFVLGMLAASTLVYLWVVCMLPSLLRLPFYPSYAAFTFPFVITPLAAKQATVWLQSAGMQIPFIGALVWVETLLAAVLVLYTLVRYAVAVLKVSKQGEPSQAVK